MPKLNLSTALNLLPVIGPALASAPEFIRLFEEFGAALGSSDQAVLKKSLELAQTNSAHAHNDLQGLVAQHAGT